MVKKIQLQSLLLSEFPDSYIQPERLLRPLLLSLMNKYMRASIMDYTIKYMLANDVLVLSSHYDYDEILTNVSVIVRKPFSKL